MTYKPLYLDYGNKQINAGIIAVNISKKYPKMQDSPDYAALEDRFYDYTQACDREEQRGWMGHYMAEALKMEQHARRLQMQGNFNSAAGLLYEAALQFLVAYNMIAD